ncbi:hypothetical protein [Candidatus Enterococcus lemimoniae]|uniref:Type VII secretion effector n=1 Tax=Candidatus Enterococcus lemimoniae TaxID=1834167 RepID=A0ABZ2T7U7_9ENTE|nr:hypothetical protein [Enterococcus sp. 12C11_DIV0727]OTO70636.1 hypothetical protein A5866_002873 [Enterococcus sp. 12C11_DIV0727]
MSETKNDPQQASAFASGLVMPFMNAYSGSSEALSISDGAVSKDINTILTQTKTLMSTFESSLKADADNLLSISNTYEAANQSMVDVVTHG